MRKTHSVFQHGSSGTTTPGRSHHALTVPNNSAQTQVPSIVTGMLPPGSRKPTETPTSERKPRRSRQGGCHTASSPSRGSVPPVVRFSITCKAVMKGRERRRIDPLVPAVRSDGSDRVGRPRLRSRPLQGVDLRGDGCGRCRWAGRIRTRDDRDGVHGQDGCHGHRPLAVGRDCRRKHL